MKIQGQGPVNGAKGAKIISAYQKAGQILKNEKAEADSVELSAEAKEIARLQKKAGNIPEVREELVKSLKQKLAANAYQVPAAKLAEKLYGEIVQERN
ncbi:flagellar biosynthesis anti-sigma factor FlgM [Zhaonella formicivorans]|uniref:flagellar biosynthesis anti-sigma factor FlgM n=1 Tax=Zhaonella formicivorans TaxID=2528593 RepID=UPI001D10327A|nr:flagellar biosynthesis anti-sigma factor FlgM [Zhaonella formicivorans]